VSRRTPPPRPTRRDLPRVQQRVSGPTSGTYRVPTRTPRASTKPAAKKPEPARAKRTVTRREPAPVPTRAHRRDAAKLAAAPAAPVKRAAPAKRTAAKQARRVVSAAPERRPRFSTGRPRRRLIVLLASLLVALGALLVKVGQLQTAGGESLRVAGAEQWTREITLPADRGTIFDRNGEELAVSIPAAAISVNPKLVTDVEGTIRMLNELLALTPDEQQRLRDELTAKDKGFVYVRREADIAVGQQLEALDIVGVNVDREDRRVLPGGETGRSVIGRTDIDGIGTAGLELQYGGGAAAGELGYDDILAGTPGVLTREVAPRGRSIPGSEQVAEAPVAGEDIMLTIDRSIQFATEEALLTRVNELQARSGYVIVMDTDSGDVLAMSSVQRNDEGVVEITTSNNAALNAYEPGSVAKVVTIAAGLNQGAVTPDSTFVIPWRKEYGEVMLSDSHQHPDELMSVEQILVESSNIGTIETQISMGFGDWDAARQSHWEYLRAFGFGERTALNYPGESPGILKHWTDLWGSERVTVAYGQGFAATPIQMISAVNAIANDGVYVAPRLVQAGVNGEGELVDAPAAETHEVVRPDVATQVQAMMQQVVCRGTGWAAQEGVTNFNVAGKTGTGLKAQPGGGYTDASGNRVYYASFAGFFPAEDPQVTVLVSIDEPPAGDINRFGGTAAAPVFAELVPVIAHEMGVQPPAVPTPCPG
jgi:cell division protein FtsI (penicillin-binding protein 3)